MIQQRLIYKTISQGDFFSFLKERRIHNRKKKERLLLTKEEKNFI
jgi:hypothetical protein